MIVTLIYLTLIVVISLGLCRLVDKGEFTSLSFTPNIGDKSEYTDCVAVDPKGSYWKSQDGLWRYIGAK